VRVKNFHGVLARMKTPKLFEGKNEVEVTSYDEIFT
jgi:hypothetical protein